MRTIRNLNLAAAALVLLLLVVVWSLAAPSGETSGVCSPETVACEVQSELSTQPEMPRAGPSLDTLSSQIRDTCPIRLAHSQDIAGR